MAQITYNPTTWQNDSAPAINAANLNNIEQGIVNAINELNRTPLFASGKTPATRVDGGQAVNIPITFGQGVEFAEPPIPVATLSANSSNISQYANLQWSVHTVSTTGFTLRLYNANPSSYLQPSLNWIAIGEKAAD